MIWVYLHIRLFCNYRKINFCFLCIATPNQPKQVVYQFLKRTYVTPFFYNIYLYIIVPLKLLFVRISSK